MDEDTFWSLIAQLDWERAGDDEAVVEPVVDSLAAMPVAQIEVFEERLTAYLHTLDTERHARAIGESAYTEDGGAFSPDQFLYARCCVVANGSEFYERVLADPSTWPQDMEFEALLTIASEAFGRKTGSTWVYVAGTSYETFSNAGGWGDQSGTRC